MTSFPFISHRLFAAAAGENAAPPLHRQPVKPSLENRAAELDQAPRQDPDANASAPGERCRSTTASDL